MIWRMSWRQIRLFICLWVIHNSVNKNWIKFYLLSLDSISFHFLKSSILNINLINLWLSMLRWRRELLLWEESRRNIQRLKSQVYFQYGIPSNKYRIFWSKILGKWEKIIKSNLSYRSDIDMYHYIDLNITITTGILIPRLAFFWLRLLCLTTLLLALRSSRVWIVWLCERSPKRPIHRDKVCSCCIFSRVQQEEQPWHTSWWWWGCTRYLFWFILNRSWYTLDGENVIYSKFDDFEDFVLVFIVELINKMIESKRINF